MRPRRGPPRDLETITADLETMIWKLRSDSETQNGGFGNYDLETKARDLETTTADSETTIWKLWGQIWKL